LGATTRVATGTPRAALAPTWARVAGLGRALLDDPAARARTKVRVAPSLVRTSTTARWLAPAEPFAEERVAELDEGLAAILNRTSDWTAWPEARRAARAAGRGADGGDLDELLLVLVDEGLLQADVTPPLVGPDAATWMRARLGQLGRASLAQALGGAQRALARGDLARGAAVLASLPGGTAAPGVHAVLVHRPSRAPSLARAVVARAAALAPLLFRLQDALAPPASERLAQPALGESLDVATELFGAGALDLGALAAGDYGVPPAGDDGDGDSDGARPEPTTPPALLTTLVDAIVAAANAGRAEAALDLDALGAALGDVGPATPPTCELFLAPVAGRRAQSGAGWLLGLHAPAGASWGRFAAALGAPLTRALDALAIAERDARPEQEALDVAFAPSPALADLCAHPRVRRRALALSAWPEGDDADDLAVADLELVADPGAETPLALRPRAGGGPVVPSPLARVRSTTAPAGTTRLLGGWSLFRQHAPWALTLGPLAAMAHVPRLTLDGFVVAPASWRVPEALRAGPADSARLRRWRREARPPRFVQIGHEDRLLAVDLDSPRAAAELVGQERAWEIWPPLGRGVDRGGRRVEAVCALVDVPDEEAARSNARAARAVTAAGRVAPPRLAPPPPDWRTFKIFGAPEHQDALLLGAILPTIAAARGAREIASWFFQRYVESPGRRHHLRLRVRAAAPRARIAFEERLRAALEPARAVGAVVTFETGDYHPERARFGDALDAAHDVFESDSDAACALLATPHDEGAAADDALAHLTPLVRMLDALARGLGLEGQARHDLARARRDAAESGPLADGARAAADAEFRARARDLRTLLGAPPRDAATRALDAHVARTARAVRGLPPAARAALAPALLHLTCVRVAGPDRALERLAYTCWERTLEGLRRAPPRSAPRALRRRRARTFRPARRQAT
ncbi:MAG TPA: thiopeptide-type bacteriocin biosynthesis protein, partial [Polyangia bacterium]|nr:thiopeptide-type bacteriocin biosynthesis protein [Polyangia bacterium]